MNFRGLGIHVKQTELDSPWQNAAEGGIRETKRGSGRKKKSPAQYGIIAWSWKVISVPIQQLIVSSYRGKYQTIVSGLEFGWYDWVKWWDVPAKFPEKEIYGQWL